MSWFLREEDISTFKKRNLLSVNQPIIKKMPNAKFLPKRDSVKGKDLILFTIMKAKSLESLSSWSVSIRLRFNN